jgi:hypothetical protein
VRGASNWTSWDRVAGAVRIVEFELLDRGRSFLEAADLTDVLRILRLAALDAAEQVAERSQITERIGLVVDVGVGDAFFRVNLAIDERRRGRRQRRGRERRVRRDDRRFEGIYSRIEFAALTSSRYRHRSYRGPKIWPRLAPSHRSS